MQENSKSMLQSEEMPLDIYSILRALLKDWWMILTAGLVGAIIAYMIVGSAYTPTYTSGMTFIVSAKGSTSNLSNLNAANEMAETFSEVLNSRLLKKKVQQELNLSYFPGNITTNVVEGTNLMSLKVSASTPELAFKIMKSVLNNYSEITQYVLSNVVLDVMEAPQVPMTPSNPVSAGAMMKKYALIGMACMIAVLTLINYLKDDVKNEKQVEQKLDTSLFGTIYHERKNKTLKGSLKKNRKPLLVTDPTSSFMFVETYKKLRTKLIYKTNQEKGKIILVTSVLENEGKSTVAVNLALTLAQKSDKVVLVDGDMRKPSVYKILEQDVKKEQELGAYLNGQVSLKNAIYQDQTSGLHLLIGSTSYENSTEMVSGERLKTLMKAVKKLADYVVIDSPPTSLIADAEILAEYADVSLLVVHQGMADVRSINDTIDILESGHSRLLGCIYNGVKTGVFSGKKIFGSYGYGNYRRYGYGHYGSGKSNYGSSLKQQMESVKEKLKKHEE